MSEQKLELQETSVFQELQVVLGGSILVMRIKEVRSFILKQLAFILQAWFCGFFVRRFSTVSYSGLLVTNLGGMVIVYVIGIAWFYLVSNYVIAAPIPLWTAIFYCGVLQALPDFLLCLTAAAIGLRCYKSGVWVTAKKSAFPHK